MERREITIKRYKFSELPADAQRKVREAAPQGDDPQFWKYVEAQGEIFFRSGMVATERFIQEMQE